MCFTALKALYYTSKSHLYRANNTESSWKKCVHGDVLYYTTTMVFLFILWLCGGEMDAKRNRNVNQ